MKLFTRHKSKNPTPLLQSQLHNEKTFYRAFSKDFKQAKNYVIIESPFITVRRSKELAPLCKKLTSNGVKVKIYTRNPLHHDGNLTYQSLDGIKILKKAGAIVEACSDMRHRKLAIIDGNILWEGSMNMLSQSCSKEIMRRSNSKSLCKEMLSFTGLTIRSW